MPAPVIAAGGIMAIILVGTGVYMAQNRIEICHATGSEKNPWQIINVSEKSWPAHQSHGDKYPVPQGGCDAPEGPGTTPPGQNF